MVTVIVSVSVAAGSKVLDHRLGIIGGIGPVAGGIDGDRAIRTDHGSGSEVGFTGIGVTDSQCTTGLEQAIQIGIDIFGDATGIDTADDGGIVGAGNGNDDIMRRTIRGGHGNRVGQGGTGREVLDHRLGVIGRVGPVTSSIDGQVTVGTRLSCRP